MEYNDRFELGGTHSAPTPEPSLGENKNRKSRRAEKKAEKAHNKEAKKQNKKGFKIGKTISALVLAGLLGVGAYVGTGAYFGYGPLKNFTENARITNLVKEYTDQDGFCSLPEATLINKAYDVNYGSGEILVKKLLANNVKYCEVLDEYYTENGINVAILTYDIATRDVLPAIEVSYGGAVVYMPVEGYTLAGNLCYKEGKGQLVKIVEQRASGDYSDVTLNTALSETETIQGATLLGISEVSTKPFSEIIDMTLICDVPDGAVLNENNQCVASFNLVPKSYKLTQ